MRENIWEGSYGKEPFDLRLTVLTLMRRMHIIVGLTLAGTLVFGGWYYVKNVLLAETLYRAGSTYHVEYNVTEEKDIGTVYINEMSWNTYVDSGLFLAAVQERAETGMTDQELEGALSAVLASDLRVPSIYVTAADQDAALRIARAVEEVMTELMPAELKEIVSVSIIDPAEEASLVKADVRVGRALVLSAVLSCFFTVVFLLLKELGDDDIRLPATMGKRYGLRVAGSLESPGLEENISYFFGGSRDREQTEPGGKRRIAVCATGQEADAEKLLGGLRARYPETMEKCGEWFTVPSPLIQAKSGQALREADGILLAVRAGKHAGKQLEYMIEYLGQQDCRIGAVILYNADEKLIRRYYAWDKMSADRRYPEGKEFL